MNIYVIALLILSILILLGFISLIYQIIKNEREFFKFRKNLKVGDETSEGVVIAINGYNVITEKTTGIENIYPLEKKK